MKVLFALLIASTPVWGQSHKKPKKDLERATKTKLSDADKSSLHKRLDSKRPPQKLINIYTLWNKEYLAVPFDDAHVVSPELSSYYLRCRFTQKETKMAPVLMRAALRAARHFKTRKIEVVSGYRSPKYNLMLRKKGGEVARNSQHTLGHALDFRLPGVPTHKLRNWARRQKIGGVGYYKKSNFIHIDIHKRRYWRGK